MKRRNAPNARDSKHYYVDYKRQQVSYKYAEQSGDKQAAPKRRLR